jgi:tRNA A37 methylthiotransferase MiaB
MLSDHIPHVEKKRRSRELIDLGRGLNFHFRKGFEGTVRDAVFEAKSPGFAGITDNYIRVKVTVPGRDITRALLPVKIVSVYETETIGKLIRP